MDTKIEKKLSAKAHEMLKKYKEEGFSNEQIRFFLEDGKALQDEGYSDSDQEWIDELHCYLTYGF